MIKRQRVICVLKRNGKEAYFRKFDETSGAVSLTGELSQARVYDSDHPALDADCRDLISLNKIIRIKDIGETIIRITGGEETGLIIKIDGYNMVFAKIKKGAKDA